MKRASTEMHMHFRQLNLVVQFTYVNFTPHKHLLSELTRPVYTNTNVQFK